MLVENAIKRGVNCRRRASKSGFTEPGNITVQHSGKADFGKIHESGPANIIKRYSHSNPRKSKFNGWKVFFFYREIAALTVV